MDRGLSGIAATGPLERSIAGSGKASSIFDGGGFAPNAMVRCGDRGWYGLSSSEGERCYMLVIIVEADHSVFFLQQDSSKYTFASGFPQVDWSRSTALGLARWCCRSLSGSFRLPEHFPNQKPSWLRQEPVGSFSGWLWSYVCQRRN